ncbi:Outer membrane protein omp85 precursor,outer membrane protein assembly factor YaeT,Outer membrane protein/protective antigen OMA87,outer membrane protein assembly complex, YaeT protein,Surface antigen variable number repeat [Chlamydia serpentis]|uniref:Outer membrane protein assembly factor BamA n=2 Tax=Chlamydia serpentis TaxID=1967782 RepID=A0A2R8FAM3_9CHLA|nr:Outer membrane protein omp85 precursor,outer membrane protein assembly factor YaeT,Outer membrane protein/protective antigen OMA87,outer membrane protein assembly complex, YaeT protein,Surface antigen variable number repeat [Chlamydia serpentis]
MRNKVILQLSILVLIQAPLILFSSEKVKEGHVVVDSITIVTEGENASNKHPLPKLKTRSGALFSQLDFDEDLRTLAKEYDAVDPKVEFCEGKTTIALRLIAKPSIRKINISGNQVVPEHKILKTLQIYSNDLFEREKFLKGLDELRTYYLKRGYFESNLDYNLEHNQEKGFIDISIQIKEGPCGKIKQLKFSGISRTEKSEIQEFIQTKQHSTTTSWFTGAGLYHPDIVEQDGLAITNYLHNRGYADATIDSHYEVDGKGNILLYMDINKGPQYTLGHVHIQGFDVLPKRLIEKQTQVGPNDLYCPDKIWDGAHKIKQTYAKYGYINTNVDVLFIPHTNRPIYDVTYEVSEGSPYKVGLIKITGNTHTKSDVILHETSLFPGDTFNRLKLEDTEQRLRNTGYFQSVSVYTVRSQLDPMGNADQYRDIFVEVKETTTGNIGLFLGFSSLDNLFGGIELSESNFDLFGIRNLFSKGFRCLRGGGEHLFLKANFGDKVTDYTLKWTKPHFLNTPWILGIELDKSINRALSKDYAVQTYGGNVSTTYILNEHLKYGLFYRGSQTSLHEKRKFLLGPNLDSNKGFVSAAGVNLNYDSVDSPRNPTTGIRGGVTFEVSGLGGTYHFTKLSLNSSIYRKLTRKGVLKIKGEAQFIKPFSNTTGEGIPMSERFFLGGETTVRGYKSFMIGPKYSATEPQGGLSSLLISEEFQYPLIKQPNISAFMFLDSGFVGLENYKISLKDLYSSAGFGLRFDVMNNVPVMLGFGWPFRPTENLNGEKIDISQRFFFALGGMF